MAEAKKAGITHLGLEISRSGQFMIDELSAGRMSETYVNISLALADAKIISPACATPDTLKRMIEYQAETIMNAKNQGIKVVAIDTGIARRILSHEKWKNAFKQAR